MEILIPNEIREKYLSRRQQDILTLRSSHSNRSMEDFKRIGHQLKGNASSFGYPDLEKIAIAMEDAAVNGDFMEAGRQLELFEKWFTQQNA